MKKLILLSILLIVGCEETLEPEDACGVAGGDGTTCADCAGVAGGNAELDNCNVCDSDKTNDCVPDCAGIWGGDTTLDECGVCGGDGIPDGDCDCDGNVENMCGDCGITSSLDECGVCYGDGSSCTFDIDGNVYETVQIGEQQWMAENLKVTHYKNGEEIPTSFSGEEWAGLESGAFAVYDDDPSNADVYGNLYNWYAVIDTSGLCINGWHIPSDEEWKELEINLGMCDGSVGMEDSYLNDVDACVDNRGRRGSNEGSKLGGNANLWNTGDLINNSEFGSSGFVVLPAGKQEGTSSPTAGYQSKGIGGYFWSSTEGITNAGWNRTVYSAYSNITRENYVVKYYGLSIRCLKD